MKKLFFLPVLDNHNSHHINHSLGNSSNSSHLNKSILNLRGNNTEGNHNANSLKGNLKGEM